MILCGTLYFVSTLSIFSKILISLPNFAFFTVKSPSVIQKFVPKESDLKKFKNPVPFKGKTIGSNVSFTLIEINFRFLRS